MRHHDGGLPRAAGAPRGRSAAAAAAVLLGAWPRAAPAQGPPPRVGVVLSGGAAKGLAHIGVLQVLEEAGVPVAVVTGTSMGALIGGLYATGYGADSLATLARAIDWNGMLSDHVARAHLPAEEKQSDGRHLVALPLRGVRPQLPAQLVPDHNVRQMLARLTWSAALIRDFRDLPIPFAAVATDLETGDVVTFTSGPLVDALTASMAIPGVFSPVPAGDRLLADGGMVRNLPAQDALALGADVLVCSDVTDPLKRAAEISSVLDVVDQTMSLLAEPAQRAERARCTILIEPDIEGRRASDFAAADDWIARGRAAATRVRTRLDSLAAAGAALPRTGEPPTARLIVALETRGTDSAHATIVRRRLSLTLPGRFGPDVVGEAMDRLYAAHEFQRVSYVLEPVGDSAVRLVVRTARPGASTLGFGLRYEGTYKASFLVTAEFSGRLGTGSHTTFDVRLGEQAHALAAHHRRIGALTPWAVGVRGGYQRVPVDIYDPSRRIAQGRFHVLGGSLFLGVASGTAALGGLLVTGEHARATVATGAAPGDTTREERTFYTVGATLRVDTRDAPIYPRGGLLVVARAEFADRAIGSGGRFAQQVLRVEGALPAGPVSLLVRAEAGASLGADLPPHYRFFLGGAVPYFMLPDRHRPFLGLRVQERSGPYYQVVGAGVQVELPARLVAQLRWEAGTVREQGVFAPSAWRQGIGATLAARTAFGTFAGHLAGEPGGTYRADLDVGFGF